MRRKLAMLAIAMTLPAVLRPPKPVLAATADMAMDARPVGVSAASATLDQAGMAAVKPGR